MRVTNDRGMRDTWLGVTCTYCHRTLQRGDEIFISRGRRANRGMGVNANGLCRLALTSCSARK